MKCISAENGTLCFAFFNIILVTVSTVCSIGVLCYWVYGVMVEDILQLIETAPTKDLVSMFVWMILSFIALVFSSFLLNGSLKKNPGHIKVYYYFGIAFIIAALCVIIVLSVLSLPANNIVLMCAAFAFVAYALVLRMIRHTYQKLETSDVTDLPGTTEDAEKSTPPRQYPEDCRNCVR